MAELNYPKHEHPHGINDTKPNEYRLWVCEECDHIFTDEEIREHTDNWGHPCKAHPFNKKNHCESHLEPFMPEYPIVVTVPKVDANTDIR